MAKIVRIAVDGPSGAGKSTVAKAVAQKLGLEYIDTGAMYRAIGYGMHERHITCDEKDRDKLIDFLNTAQVNFKGGHVCLNGEDIADRIRTPEISKIASDCSALPPVRAKLVNEQREMGKTVSVIMDGRDIGTNVFPDAELKIFLTASAEERARRRLLELQTKGETQHTFEEILADMKQRDYNDSHRALNPLCQADDAILVDTTDMNEQEVVEAILKLAKKTIG